ncbi:MAG: hypothetical protein KGQ86_09195 [Bacteroidetes bacterium]|nr:hypothetical protein [Bacteroidota bacterium]
MFRILALLLLPVICLGQVNSNGEKPTGELLSNEIAPNDMKRNASFNVDEIKVRWKKAALENCAGVPCVTTPVFTCGTSTVSDIDNNSYPTVVIGNQCWTQSNLKVTRYNDGTLIPDFTNITSIFSIPSSGARAEYVGSGVPSSGYVGTYGYLYNWYAVADSRKLCPTGWHVPSKDEWDLLILYLGGNIIAGGKMKSTSSLWTTQSSGANNSSGFTVLPGGIGGSSVISANISLWASFWSSSVGPAVGQPTSYAITLQHAIDQLNNGTSSNDQYSGRSVRCLKD